MAVEKPTCVVLNFDAQVGIKAVRALFYCGMPRCGGAYYVSLDWLELKSRHNHAKAKIFAGISTTMVIAGLALEG